MRKARNQGLQHFGTSYEPGTRPVFSQELINLYRTNEKFRNYCRISEALTGKEHAFKRVMRSSDNVARQHEREEQRARELEHLRKRSEELASYA